ncbi:chymotrypsin-like protease CTRL-1 [Brachionus plicatilis]|uniref:Chymotrypsin-like protease CTRL-1 n=1 Tax=Brachionus plicatilis TaxID=10195 RepID=A0A3M7QAY4_BRAPC|nr:chymotrypsin-like protease CTRL-1 [Brachionus plicatilis]
MKHILSLVILITSMGACWQCGRPVIQPSIKAKKLNRIINGDFAVKSSWPWTVSIRYVNNSRQILHSCGGTLISHFYVITAAHCFITKRTRVVVIGSSNLNDRLKPKNIFRISKIHIHPQYNSNFLENDVAIIRLSRKVFFNRNRLPICLPKTTDISPIFNKSVVVVGWGSSNGSNNRKALSSRLTQAVLRVYNEQNNFDCKRFETNNYCAYDPTSRSANICFGDSGGPLMFYENNRWTLYGVTNFMLNDPVTLRCHNRMPSFYLMIPNYIKWIKQTINS